MKGGLLSTTELVWPPSLILKDRHPAVSKDLGLHFYSMFTKFCEWNGTENGNGISLF